MPGAIPTKPGSATLPCFGIVPQIVDSDGAVLEGPCEGNLVSFFYLFLKKFLLFLNFLRQKIKFILLFLNLIFVYTFLNLKIQHKNEIFSREMRNIKKFFSVSLKHGLE